MNSVIDATTNVMRDSFQMLSEALQNLPDAAMDWQPAENANSFGVLVLHSVSATRFLVRAGVGEQVSLAEYRAEDRPAAFASKGRSVAELARAITDARTEIEQLVASADADGLSAMRTFPEDPSQDKTGVQCLIHAAAHLREHVGQAQLTRDLWLAENGA
jgi:uncharacterized damage-inducible protein DinB